ncbi:unnamed protein product, partial [Tetraodon nigroviridis]
QPQILSGSGFCKWFNVRMGFGFISMTHSEGSPVDPPLDVFVHQSVGGRNAKFPLWATCVQLPLPAWMQRRGRRVDGTRWVPFLSSSLEPTPAHANSSRESVLSKLVMEGFRSLKEGEQVEFTFKKSTKGLESLRVTGPGGGPCAGSERRPKGKIPLQKRKPKGDRCYNCGGLDHHAKECGLPPQPKKCHYCQSITHMVAQCPHKAL